MCVFFIIIIINYYNFLRSTSSSIEFSVSHGDNLKAARVLIKDLTFELINSLNNSLNLSEYKSIIFFLFNSSSKIF